MPTYEFRCSTCETTFEEQRPMSRSGEPATCPSGHDGARRVLSMFMSAAKSNGGGGLLPSTLPTGGGFGGCGSGCGCH